MNDSNGKAVFETGAMKIELTQADMAAAVEYWLNGKVMKVPVVVTSLVKTKTTVYSSAIFEVVIEDTQK